MSSIRNQKDLDEAISKVLMYSRPSRFVKKTSKELTHTSRIEELPLEGGGGFEVVGTIYILKGKFLLKMLRVEKTIYNIGNVKYIKEYIFQEMYDEFMIYVVNTLAESFEKEGV